MREKILHPLLILVSGIFASVGATADEIFDDPNDTEEVAASITFDDFTVYAGLSLVNTAPDVNSSWNRETQVEDALVWWDTNPSNGGLGVDSPEEFTGNSDTDNFEGSMNGNTNYDEILFFDFNSAVTLVQILLNAGDESQGTSHQDLFTSSASDVFDIFYSMDGVTYNCIFCVNTSPANGEELNLPAGTAGKYFAVAHLGPVASVGGYIESIHYEKVPEPGTLALLGAGLLGVGMSRRRRKA